MAKHQVRITEMEKLKKLVDYANKVKPKEYKDVTQEAQLDALIVGQFEKIKHLL